MKNLVILVPVVESERDWGQRLDDYKVCLTKADANDFVKEFNAKNDLPSAPEWYMFADTPYKTMDISDTQLAELNKNSSRMWWSQLKTIE